MLGREPVGQGALHAAQQRSGRAGHGVDVERDRQGRRRLAARARRRRSEEGLPAQPPDQRRAAAGRRPDDQQLGSGDRPGRLVRRAGAHCGRPSRKPTSTRRRSPPCRARPACSARRSRSPTSRAGAAMIDWLKACCSRTHWPTARRARPQSTRPRSAPIRPSQTLAKQLALVIDLNVCVGCHACVTSLQGMEHLGLGRPARRRERLRREPDRHLLQPRPDLRSRRLPGYRDDPLPEELPALRGAAVRAGVPDRRELQARRRRHRPGRLRQVHRLQVLRMGLPVRRTRDRRRAPGDDQVHALRRPRLRRRSCAAPTGSRPASRPARPARACSAT